VVGYLGRLEFLDSTGLAMLVAATREGGKRLSFLPSEHDAVRRLLTLTGLDERMKLAPTLTLSVSDAGGTADSETLQPAA
jgi:anti-anti-sigma factor